MANDPKWSHWTPEQHTDEAQRLVEIPDVDTADQGLLLAALAQVHATLAAAKMTDRLDSTLLDVYREYRTSGLEVNVSR